MNIKTFHSNKKHINDLVSYFKQELNNFDTKLLVYFASSSYNQQELNNVLSSEFSNCKILGCSSAGEIISGYMLKDYVVVMAINSNIIEDLKIEIVENITDVNSIKLAFTSFENHFGCSTQQFDFTKYIGIVLMDGLSLSEELVMDKIGDFSNITFIGGSAGDDLKFEKTYVCTNGKCCTNAVAIALLKTKNGFDTIKTQSFTNLSKKLIATKVNAEDREVIEFNNKPAKDAYAEALGIDVNNLQQNFMTHPVGLISGDEIFVRSPKQIKDNGNIAFYCNILEGMEVSLLQSQDIIKDTQDSIADKLKELPHIEGILNFNCILRTLELEKKNQTDAYGKIFSNIPTIGLSTYGEAYIGHINQTATMLVFK